MKPQCHVMRTCDGNMGSQFRMRRWLSSAFCWDVQGTATEFVHVGIEP